MRKIVFPTFILLVLITLIFSFVSCGTTDNPEVTGTFTAEFSGDFSKAIDGNATFRLEGSGLNGIIIVRLDESETSYIRLTFPNPSPTEIVLEPGTYTIVKQLNNDIWNEVLVDYVDNGLSFSASSGSVGIGISKETQLSGDIRNASFTLLSSICNGTFDAKPE